VHALVRDAGDARARALQSQGAVLFTGAMGNAAAIEAAIRGCAAVFLAQMPDFTDAAGEATEARAVLDAARAAGVRHVVHSTVLSLADPLVLRKTANSVVAPALAGKAEVEALVRACGIGFTILRPGFFMTNLVAPLVGFMFPELGPSGQGGEGGKRKFEHSYGEGAVLPLVDPDDIGAFAAAALQDPERFAGRVVSVASEKLSIEEIAAELGRAVGREVEVVCRSEEETAVLSRENPLVAGQVNSRGLSELVDLEEVKGWGIKLTAFRVFLEKNREVVGM
jgi:uncharacterized protein YbjT (DUF2867 family)